MMSGMNGYQVCRKLKDDDRTRGIPVIFVTSMDHEEDEAAGLDAGAIDYLTKPIRASIVKARVRNHLELKRARDLLAEPLDHRPRSRASRTAGSSTRSSRPRRGAPSAA